MRSNGYIAVTAEELTEIINNRFDQLIDAAKDDEIISPEQAESMTKLRCIVAERNIFGKLWNKLFERIAKENGDKNVWTYVIQKILGSEKGEE